MIVTLDFETFYSSSYSLTSKHLNTSSYIRDNQFKVHCVGIKIGKNKTKCYHGLAIARELSKIKWEDVELVCHNTAFDAAILAWHYDIIPKFYYDTMSMTRGLHNEVSRASLDTIARFYGIGAKSKTYLVNTRGKRELKPEVMEHLKEGCITDVDLTYEIFKQQSAIYPQNELRLIDMTIRMFVDPTLMVDIPRAERAHTYEVQERLRSIACSGVTEDVLNSSNKLAAELTRLGVEVPMKPNKYGVPTYAFAQTDFGFQELLEHEDRRVVLLAQGRLAAKSTINETRAKRLIQAGEHGQRLPVLLNYYGAKTGRWSGGNKLNLQNLTRIEFDKDGKPIPGTGELRQSIIAPPGHKIVVCDSAQIEARFIAWLAGQNDVVQAFADKRDVYCEMASVIYEREITKANKLERFIGKIAVLGLGYGMGHKKFQTTLALGIMGPPVELSISECKRIVNIYRNHNKHIVRLWRIADQTLRDLLKKETGEHVVEGQTILEWDDGSVWMPNGMGLHYPGLDVNARGDITYLSHGIRKKIYGGLLVENEVQALSRIAISEQMLDVQDQVLSKLSLKNGEVARIATMTHEEIVSVVPDRYADKVLKKKIEIMSIPPAWAPGVPLGAEGGYANNYIK